MRLFKILLAMGGFHLRAKGFGVDKSSSDGCKSVTMFSLVFRLSGLQAASGVYCHSHTSNCREECTHTLMGYLSQQTVTPHAQHHLQTRICFI